MRQHSRNKQPNRLFYIQSSRGLHLSVRAFYVRLGVSCSLRLHPNEASTVVAANKQPEEERGYQAKYERYAPGQNLAGGNQFELRGQQAHEGLFE